MDARLLRLTRVVAGAAALITVLQAPAGAGELPALAALEERCAGGCDREDRAALAIRRAGVWLRDFGGALQFDGAFLLTLIRDHVDSEELRAAFAAAKVRADHDHDHPHRRLWTEGFVSPPEHTSRWPVPGEGDARVNPNRVLSEALHCRENGWRAATEAYVCGPMRDAGGYQTTHAIWALDFARRNGCTEAAACLASLRAELRASQPGKFLPVKTLDIDLYAERTALYVRTGDADAESTRWVDALLGLQQANGSWGVGIDPDPWFRYHATAVSAWALAEWAARREPAPRS